MANVISFVPNMEMSTSFAPVTVKTPYALQNAFPMQYAHLPWVLEVLCASISECTSITACTL